MLVNIFKKYSMLKNVVTQRELESSLPVRECLWPRLHKMKIGSSGEIEETDDRSHIQRCVAKDMPLRQPLIGRFSPKMSYGGYQV